MFDIGWSEMAVVVLIALIVIGPKELPKAMRSIAKWTSKARTMAREFQSGIDEMVREADLEDARKAIESAKSLDIGKAVEETIDPTGGMRDEAKELEEEMAREAVAEDAGASADGADALAATEDTSSFETPGDIAPSKTPTPPAEPAVATPEPEPAAAAADANGTKQPA
jgi:sec-independent protein translocase protein TatB